MSKIEKTIRKLDRKALIAFITAGDPDYETSLAVLKALPGAGADIIELGMPFTDPVADGPVIQEANIRALGNGATMHKTLQMVRDFRKDNRDTPLVLMGYYNPVMAYGPDKFVNDAAQAGADGFIIVDLPPEEDQDLRKLCEDRDIDLVRLLTPTSKGERLPVLLEGVSGFLYYVSVAGVTGGAKADLETLKPHLEQIKAQTDLPLALGFGIKTPDDVRQMAALSDAVVVGSAIIKTMQEAPKGQEAESVAGFVRTLSEALKS